MRIQRLSWAGIKLEVGQTTLFIDAVRASPEDVPLHVDTPYRHALLTHHHGDHADPIALQSVLMDGSWLVTHHDVISFLHAPATRLRAVGHYQPVLLDPATADFTVWAVPAVDGLGDPQVSWVVEGGGIRIFHGGDTLWHGHWWNLARTYGPFDVAFLPINGARFQAGRYNDSGIPIVMTPEQAAAAAALLGARITVPIHYGLHDPPRYVEVPDAAAVFADRMRERGLAVTLLKPGETLVPNVASPQTVPEGVL